MSGSGPLILALGWALVHFVWQGAVIGLVCWALLKALETSRPATRYWVGMAGLAGMAVAPLVTFLVVLPNLAGAGADGALTGGPELVAGPSTALFAVAGSASVASRLETLLPVAVALWLSGVLLMVFRLLRDIRQVNQLVSRDVSPVSRHWEAVMTRLAGSLCIRQPVRILESARVSVPLVIGWLKPTILIPPSALLGLTPRQLELIIAHELAHVRRADWLFNLFQVVVETVLFYHPAVRLLSRRIRAEREHCCDDIVVAVTGDSLTYARALTEVEGLRATLTARMAIGASDGQLAGRVTRLVAPPRTQRGFVQWVPALLLVSSAAITAGSLDRWPVAPVFPPPASQPGATAAPVATAGSVPSETPEPDGGEAARESGALPEGVPLDRAIGATTKNKAQGPDRTVEADGTPASVAPAVALPREPAGSSDSSAEGALPDPVEEHGRPQAPAGPNRIEVAAISRDRAGSESESARVREERVAAAVPPTKPEILAGASAPMDLPPVVPAVLESTAFADDDEDGDAAEPAGHAARLAVSPDVSEPTVDPAQDSTGFETRAGEAPSAAAPRYTGGRLVRGDVPQFPRRARTRAEGGRVVVAYTIDARGHIQNLEFTQSSGRDFTLAVKRALKRWRFEPYALDGKPVSRRVARTFDFQLEAGGPALDEDSRCGYATASRLCRRYASAGNPDASPPDPHPVDECERVTGSRICGSDVLNQHVVVVYEAN